MNRYIRRVLATYILALLILCAFLPWYGLPVDSWAGFPVFLQAPLWHPPSTFGYIFYLDIVRLALAILSLSAVMVAAMISLWGTEEK
jgi:hypothetical protein